MVQDAGIRGTISLAGRVNAPAPQALPHRVGGFGGVPGLIAYLRENGITHLIDATHPFAAQMSAHAVVASAQTGVKLIALTRPPWRAEAGDDWIPVADFAEAAAALAGPRRRVLLAVGRLHLEEFAVQPQHHYVLRLVDQPRIPPPFPDHHGIISRGPFSEEGDLALMREHGIELVVSKNSGGGGAYAKIAAARRLGLPVVMIDRPCLKARREVFSVAEVMEWIAHESADLGV